MPAKTVSYFQKRMKQLGVVPQEESIFKVDIPDPNKKGKEYTTKLFSGSDTGDIGIHYYQLNGAPYSYRKDGNKWSENYVRYRVANPVGFKYRSPKDQGILPWFSPGVIKKYNKGEAIKQLHFIEGEFKSFAADNIGADVVGIGGIHGFYAKKVSDYDPHFLHEDIAELLKKTKVETVVLSLDADTLCIKWKHDKDLFTRQNSFRTAVSNFYKVMQYYVDDDAYALKNIYFSHIKRKFVDNAKGIDDLLEERSKEKQRILNDMQSLNEAKEETDYFDFLKLDENFWTALETYFGLESVEKFYEKYRDDIDKKQFVYRNAKYVYDSSGKPRFIYHKDVENFFRIGTDWMKKIKVPNKFGSVDEKIVPFSISEINRDYPEKRFPGFVTKIKKYDAYCNEPDWSSNYNREHSGCYNLANPITHTPEPGNCPSAIKFVKHIFSGNGNVKIVNPKEVELEAEFAITDKKDPAYGTYRKHYPISDTQVFVEDGKLGDQFTVGLDWLSIFHRYPKQMLPVPILVSKEFGTGKTTFFKWMKSIYGSNTSILNNEQFKMRFNAHYITNSLIIIDEGFLDVDKKAEKERLKQLVTSDTAYVEHKGVNLQEFPYYGKVMMGSNDADSVMKMDSDENRWFVVKVNALKSEDKDPDMEEKLRKEIPAWLHYLEIRGIQHPREQRLWFKEDYFITEQFKEIVRNTKTRLEKNIDDLVKDMFITYKQRSITMSRKTLVNMLNEQSKYKTDQQEVKRYLDKQLGMKLEGPSTIRHPNGFQDDDGNTIAWSPKSVERHYVFNVEDWVKEDDFESEEEAKMFFTKVKKMVTDSGVIISEEDGEDDLPF